jgi:hypothetical protein
MPRGMAQGLADAKKKGRGLYGGGGPSLKRKPWASTTHQRGGRGLNKKGRAEVKKGGMPWA